jgi:hypothetical protein
MTSVQAISSMTASAGSTNFFLITRTATLHGTRLQRESDGAWQPIVAAVDYVLGDSVRLEAQRSAQTM